MWREWIVRGGGGIRWQNMVGLQSKFYCFNPIIITQWKILFNAIFHAISVVILHSQPHTLIKPLAKISVAAFAFSAENLISFMSIFRNISNSKYDDRQMALHIILNIFFIFRCLGCCLIYDPLSEVTVENFIR